MNKKAPLATSYHKVLQSITKYYNVLVVLLRISPYYKVPLRTPIYEEMLCTTRYYNVVVYSVLQSIKTYYKLLLRTPKYNYVFKRSLGVKLPNMEGWTAEMGRVREWVEERQGKRQKKKDTGARTVGKVGKRRVSPMMGGSGRSRHVQIKVPNTSASNQFWQFGCRQNAKRFHAKYVSKPKHAKHHSANHF